MIERRAEAVHDSPERRERLRGEYGRIMDRTRSVLQARPDVRLLMLHHEDILREPVKAADAIGRFVGETLDTALAALTVDRSLHRNRSV
jgi:hypothetical protein